MSGLQGVHERPARGASLNGVCPQGIIYFTCTAMSVAKCSIVRKPG